MSPDKSLQYLFNAALERSDAAERARFLDEACGADTALRERVEKLLRAQEEVGAFMAQPSRKPAGLDLSQTGRVVIPLTEKPGDRIGRYKLLQQIGEGGCGVVYMAEQEEPVRRRVALKVIKLGMDTKQVIARFEAERQALALMDHPNIAKIFDAGVTGTPVAAGILPAVEPGFRPSGKSVGSSGGVENSETPAGSEASPGGKMPPSTAGETPAATLSAGRPYFVMELVRGVKITEFCDENKLSTEDRLNLFMQVCQAIQHAHQKGVIHRDIKPSNILVTINDGVPVPKVIDFGIAKATAGRLTDHTLFTAFEQFIGTPAYMSPEQAVMTSLDIDTRSDIYSLGVLLYELLTGSPPFDQKELLAAGLDEMRRTIRETEPPKPSTRLTQELVAADVRRRTSGQAESSASSPRRLQELIHHIRGDLDWIAMKCLEKDRARRYETANALAVDIRRHLENEPIVARPPSRLYEFQRTVQRHKFGFAAAAALILVLTLGVVISTWQAVRATKAEKLANDRLAEVAAERDAKELARRAATKAEQLAKDRLAEAEAISTFMGEVIRSPDPARDGRIIQVVELLDRAAKKLETELAGQPGRRAALQAKLADTYNALGLYREAIPLQEKVRDYYLTTFGPENPDTLLAARLLANCYYRAGRRDEALKMHEEALALLRKALGPEHPDTLSVMNNMAVSYAEAGRRDEALKLREVVLTLRRKVSGPEHLDTLPAMINLADSYDDAGRLAEAFKLREEVLTLRRRILGSEHPETLRAMHVLANSYHNADRRDEALKLREEVLMIGRKVNGPEHPDTLDAMNNLAISYAEAGRRDEALKLREEVLTLRRKVLGPEHPRTLNAMYAMANSYQDAGRRDEALKMYEEALTLHRKVLGPEHPHTLNAMYGLAISYTKAGRNDEALKLNEQVLVLRRKVLGPEHPDTLVAMNAAATCYGNSGRKGEALKLREEVLPLSRKVKGPEDPATLGDMTNLAISYLEAGRLAEALALQEEALDIERRVLPQNHPSLTAAMGNLANIYQKTGRRDDALKLREEVLALRRNTLGPEHPDTVWAMISLAGLYRGSRLDEAIKLGQSSVEVSRRVSGPTHADTLNAMTELAISYRVAGQISEAIELEEESLQLKRQYLSPGHSWTIESIRNLIICYEKSDRKPEAEVLRQEAAELRAKAKAK